MLVKSRWMLKWGLDTRVGQSLEECLRVWNFVPWLGRGFSPFEGHRICVGNKTQIGFSIVLACFWTHCSRVKVVCRLHELINKATVMSVCLQGTWERAGSVAGLSCLESHAFAFSCSGSAWETWLEDEAFLAYSHNIAGNVGFFNFFFSLLLSKCTTITNSWLCWSMPCEAIFDCSENYCSRNKGQWWGRISPKRPWEERDGIQISSLQKNLEEVEEVKSKTLKEQR